MSFLNAEWRKLAIANYEVDTELLKPFVPAKTELDLWEGKCYLSLVGFMFLNTRLRGLKVPFHINFEEVNLRFYVKYYDGSVWKRGVVFIREIVPKPALSLVANTVYKENYVTLPMKHAWKTEAEKLLVSYSWRKNKLWNEFTVTASPKAELIELGSEAEFITEHYWGYSKHDKTKTIEYEVTHPRWQQYPVLGYHIDVDFAQVYGGNFAFLKELEPLSVFLAEGSEITVESKRVLG